MVINNNIINQNLERIKASNAAVQTKQNIKQSGAFDAILKEKLHTFDGLKFSKHAELRLLSRNIRLSQSQLDRVGEAVKKAENKGIKDTLVLADNIALVVNVKSKTVITAMDQSEIKDNVFTNIDGAVIT